jgi:hypothetical protein
VFHVGHCRRTIKITAMYGIREDMLKLHLFKCIVLAVITNYVLCRRNIFVGKNVTFLLVAGFLKKMIQNLQSALMDGKGMSEINCTFLIITS